MKSIHFFAFDLTDLPGIMYANAAFDVAEFGLKIARKEQHDPLSTGNLDIRVDFPETWLWFTNYTG